MVDKDKRFEILALGFKVLFNRITFRACPHKKNEVRLFALSFVCLRLSLSLESLRYTKGYRFYPSRKLLDKLKLYLIDF